MKKTHHHHIVIGILGISVLILGTITALQDRSLRDIHTKIATLSADTATNTQSTEEIRSTVSSVLKIIEDQGISLTEQLKNEQRRIDDLNDDVDDFDRDVDKLSDTVDTLEKLTTTDPELLQKYSKVYFLNEHYTPSDLVVIDEKYDLVNGKEVTIHALVWPYLEELLEEAWDDNVDLMVLSGYRSFEEQTLLKDSYVTRYGTGANQFSADQGYSEHQLGTTVDFTDKEIGQYLTGFDQTEAFDWLTRYAYKYGFVMSYPENNEHYVYEPWHWRFVGEDLARDLHRKEKGFYDLEQREIDEYIPTLFD